MIPSATPLAARLERNGWCSFEGAVEADLLDAVVAETTGRIERAGLRNLLSQSSSARQLATHPTVRDLPEALLGAGAFVVRAILFDKTPETNWKVPWHQDRTIAVRERRDVDGFGPWSTKDGVVHVEPPADVLERMVTVRLHLDDCGLDNGPLRVLEGSHRAGKLDTEAIDRAKAMLVESTCTVPRGGVVAFVPLLLHASSPAPAPAHRRVVHLEFAADPLPGGLEWAESAEAVARRPRGAASPIPSRIHAPQPRES